MGKRRASTLSEKALKEEHTEAMNAFYHYENLAHGRVPFDVFGKRARDLKRRVRDEFNFNLHVAYSRAKGSPTRAVTEFSNFIEMFGGITEYNAAGLPGRVVNS